MLHCNLNDGLRRNKPLGRRFITEPYPTLSLATRDYRWAKMRTMMKRLELDCVLVFGLKGREQFEGYLANGMWKAW